MTARLDATLRLLSQEGGDQLTADELRAQLNLGPGEDIQVFELEPHDPSTGLGHYAVVPLEEIEAWENGTALISAAAGSTECREVADEMLASLRTRLGRAALAELDKRLQGAMAWARANYDQRKGDFRTFARAVARKALQRLASQVGTRRLRAEKLEQDDRDAASNDATVLARYLGRVMKRFDATARMEASEARRVRSPRCAKPGSDLCRRHAGTRATAIREPHGSVRALRACRSAGVLPGA